MGVEDQRVWCGCVEGWRGGGWVVYGQNSPRVDSRGKNKLWYKEVLHGNNNRLPLLSTKQKSLNK